MKEPARISDHHHAPMSGLVRVRLDGRIIAETERALDLREAGYEAGALHSHDDVEARVLTPNPRRTHCPYKGEASYFDLCAGGEPQRAAAWSYQNPFPAWRASAAISPSIATGSRSSKLDAWYQIPSGWRIWASLRRRAGSLRREPLRSSASRISPPPATKIRFSARVPSEGPRRNPRGSVSDRRPKLPGEFTEAREMTGAMAIAASGHAPGYRRSARDRAGWRRAGGRAPGLRRPVPTAPRCGPTIHRAGRAPAARHDPGWPADQEVEAAMRVLPARRMGEGALKRLVILEIGQAGEIVAQDLRIEALFEARPAQACASNLRPRASRRESRPLRARAPAQRDRWRRRSNLAGHHGPCRASAFGGSNRGPPRRDRLEQPFGDGRQIGSLRRQITLDGDEGIRIVAGIGDDLAQR